MLATLTTAGSSSGWTQTESGRSERAMRRATISCSSRTLALCSICSPRWSSTAGSALRRVDPARATVAATAPLAADQQLGAGADEGRLGRADAEAEAGREDLAEGAEDRRRDRARRARSTVTSRASTVFSSSPRVIRSTAAATACS